LVLQACPSRFEGPGLRENRSPYASFAFDAREGIKLLVPRYRRVGVEERGGAA
jgi:hypothetical protein